MRVGERQPKGVEGKRKVGKRIVCNWKCRKVKLVSQKPESNTQNH